MLVSPAHYSQATSQGKAWVSAERKFAERIIPIGDPSINNGEYDVMSLISSSNTESSP